MTDIKIQEPGVLGGVEVNKLDALLEMSVAELSLELDGLSALELEQLKKLEEAGKARIGALRLIVAAIDVSKLGEPKAVNNDVYIEHPYAHMNANDIDRSTLTKRVLTLQGWLLPLDSVLNVE